MSPSLSVHHAYSAGRLINAFAELSYDFF